MTYNELHELSLNVARNMSSVANDLQEMLRALESATDEEIRNVSFDIDRDISSLVFSANREAYRIVSKIEGWGRKYQPDYINGQLSQGEE